MTPIRVLTTVAAISMAFAANTVAAGCVFPGPADIEIPDGATATEQQMIETQKKVKAYVAEMETYIECLDGEAAALKAAEGISEEQVAINEKRYNSAVELMQGVAELFNVQVRIYRDNNS